MLTDRTGGQMKAVKTRRQRIWEGQMRARAGVIRAYQGKVSKVLNEFRAIALRKLEQHGEATRKALGAEDGVTKSLIDFIFDPKAFGKQLVLSLNPVAQMAVEAATAHVLSQAGKADDPWRMPPPRVKELIASRAGALEKVGETVRDVINTQLSEGYDAGESTAELMDRIRGKFNDLSKGEAKRIAITETQVVWSTSAHETAEGVGVPYHGWLTSGLGNSRQDHQDAEDDYQPGGSVGPIPIDEPFNVGGEQLMHPGDSSGSAGEIINCHCKETFHMEGGKEN